MSVHEQFGDDLALYALGSLAGEERAALERHLAECADCRRELDLLRGDMALLALEVAGPSPPQRARKRLLDGLGREPRLRAIPMQRRWWMLTPVFASLVLAIFAILLWRDIAGQRRRIEQLKAEVVRNESQVQHAREVLAVMEAPDAMRVTLVPGQAQPQPQGRAFYMPRKGALVFMASNLAMPPAHKTYELWLVPMQGAPIPAGTFMPDAHGSASVMMPPLPAGVEAKAFAVTMENEGGSPTPTMPMVLVGAG